eukprot:CAMPEP_0177434030 /NCGR_PEP_ID=MMETSP0369-20130122/179_1 /TAXON_ID=447022 ORGANISM="Scrippsiella hangoei-like, Strain SHHI-4" /NCGR_SAMPLE_ID=MMETSP0369 /ASSEMBLY_ACC=CAM_ASM_000364 /LENGTH=138 /DNA_ID=CAMNT_0018904853 /DNA_START=316 /DNA_END=732 /DNA_ORIENTATION=+
MLINNLHLVIAGHVRRHTRTHFHDVVQARAREAALTLRQGHGSKLHFGVPFQAKDATLELHIHTVGSIIGARGPVQDIEGIRRHVDTIGVNHPRQRDDAQVQLASAHKLDDNLPKHSDTDRTLQCILHNLADKSIGKQ